jgi:MerR family mercuric resistance operon transcriptional regulator
MAGLKIGEVARRSGTTVKAIRFYEAKGLLPRPVRSPSGYRLYADRDLKRLAFIQRAKLLGLSLAKIHDLVIHLAEDGSAGLTIRPHLER